MHFPVLVFIVRVVSQGHTFLPRHPEEQNLIEEILRFLKKSTSWKANPKSNSKDCKESEIKAGKGQ